MCCFEKVVNFSNRYCPWWPNPFLCYTPVVQSFHIMGRRHWSDPHELFEISSYTLKIQLKFHIWHLGLLDSTLVQIGPPIHCENFHERKNWYWAAMIIGFISSLLQIVGLCVNHDIFVERMTWPIKREGEFHRSIWRHVENFCDYIVNIIENRFCFGRKMMTRKSLRGKKVHELTNYQYYFAILCVILSVMLELLKHFFDIPYTNMANWPFFNDGCNSATAGLITKPVVFYVLFIAAQIYGVWVFWYCAIELNADSSTGVNRPWRFDDDTVGLHTHGYILIVTYSLTVEILIHPNTPLWNILNGFVLQKTIMSWIFLHSVQLLIIGRVGGSAATNLRAKICHNFFWHF